MTASRLQCYAADPHPAHDWYSSGLAWRCPGIVEQWPRYVYVASSWKNPIYPEIIAGLEIAKIPHYDFRNPEPGNMGFHWSDAIDGGYDEMYAKHSLVTSETYMQMLEHPISDSGFKLDWEAMHKADTIVLILPCGKSAHLELGWAVGAGKRTAILLEDPMQPELMYKMVDKLCKDQNELIDWLLGVKQ